MPGKWTLSLFTNCCSQQSCWMYAFGNQAGENELSHRKIILHTGTLIWHIFRSQLKTFVQIVHCVQIYFLFENVSSWQEVNLDLNWFLAMQFRAKLSFRLFCSCFIQCCTMALRSIFYKQLECEALFRPSKNFAFKDKKQLVFSVHTTRPAILSQRWT